MYQLSGHVLCEKSFLRPSTEFKTHNIDICSFPLVNKLCLPFNWRKKLKSLNAIEKCFHTLRNKGYLNTQAVCILTNKKRSKLHFFLVIKRIFGEGEACSVRTHAGGEGPSGVNVPAGVCGLSTGGMCQRKVRRPRRKDPGIATRELFHKVVRRCVTLTMQFSVVFPLAPRGQAVATQFQLPINRPTFHDQFTMHWTKNTQYTFPQLTSYNETQ